MPQFDFTLQSALPPDESDSDALVERLYSAGCHDALVGIGLQGRLALQFTRESPTAAEAVRSAIDDVLRAVPEAVLAEASPVRFSETYLVKDLDARSVHADAIAHPLSVELGE